MIRLLVVTHNTKLSGAEIALGRILEMMDRRRVEVHVVLPDAGPLCEQLRRVNGITLHILESAAVAGLRKQGGSSIANWMILPWHLSALVVRLARVIRRERIDVVLCSSIKADFYAGLSSWMAARPCAWYIHDYVDDHYFARWLQRALGTAGRWLPRLVLANSQPSLEALARIGIPRKRLRVVYYPAADPPVGPPAGSIRAELGLSADARLVTLVGRMAPMKGQLEFVEAAARIAARFPDTTFLLVGDSLFGKADEVYRDEVVTRLNQPELAGRVRWLRARADAAAITAQSTVAVMNSLGPEGFGLVAAEAMWGGVPLVGTALGGMADMLIHEQTGLVVKARDVTALGDAIAQLLVDPAQGRQLAVAARQRIETLQSAENVRRLESLIEELARSGDE